MKYRLEISRKALKQMQELTKTMRRRVDAQIESLRDDPYKGSTKLKSIPGFRQRVGDYRLLYKVDDDQRLVHVIAVVHRREAYR